MQSSSEQLLVGEERYVTTRITAAKETIYQITVSLKRVFQWIKPEHELMADRGFAIQDLCALKGIYLNRPAQKLSDQFTQAEVASNLDIASTRIHVERFIG